MGIGLPETLDTLVRSLGSNNAATGLERPKANLNVGPGFQGRTDADVGMLTEGLSHGVGLSVQTRIAKVTNGQFTGRFHGFHTNTHPCKESSRRQHQRGIERLHLSQVHTKSPSST